ncbi:MAG: hypothetical protein JXR51_11010 [Bacteroidales bacterium]|nr:hypothetical protein [Bacteroidales bacterium]MBN2757698.1 hypothetical protein [Bacteroidales bacterium]
MEENTFKRDVFVDFAQMLALLLGSVFVVYFTNPIVRDLFFIIPLALSIKSKKDYFWFAYFFILISAPASLFVNRTQEAYFRLPFYTVISGFSFTPMDLFLFISIFKAIRKKVKVKFLLNKPLEFFLFYMIIISIPVSFLLGTEIKPFINTMRSFFFYGIIFSYLRLINGKEEILKFGYLMIPPTILIVFDQLYVINMGSRFISMLDPSMLGVFVKNSISGDIRAVVQGILIVFYTLIFGFQISNNKKYEIFSGFSSIAIFLPIASFILSATRSWMTIGIVAIFGYIFLSKKGIKFAIQMGVVGAALVIAIFSSGFIEADFLNNIYARYSVIIDAASSGNVRDADTFSGRIDEDIPHVMKGFAYSPILGVGMSKYMRQFYSNDVGFINTLLIYGIIGFPVFLFFLFRYLFLLNKYRLKNEYDQTDKNIFISLILGFLGILAGYFFTWDFFSFYPEKVFFVSIIFATGDLVLELKDRKSIS